MSGEIYPQITQMDANSEMLENICGNLCHLWLKNGFEEVGV
jgi:hypothetical protein